MKKTEGAGDRKKKIGNQEKDRASLRGGVHAQKKEVSEPLAARRTKRFRNGVVGGEENLARERSRKNACLILMEARCSKCRCRFHGFLNRRKKKRRREKRKLAELAGRRRAIFCKT